MVSTILTFITTALSLASAVSASPLVLRNKRQVNYPGFDYDNEKVRGVNIGGWLLLEPYITPSLFEAFGTNEADIPVDEYHFTQWLGPELASSRLQQHWSSWYTEQDFLDIAQQYKLNHVRIPIGYWAFKLLPGDPYVQGAEAYLDQAICWARNAGLKVWVDLHGAPGSQNGFDNSGERDVLNWQKDNNTAITVEVLNYMAQKYGSDEYNDVVTAIELVNEPLGPELNMDEIKQFYLSGYSTVRDNSNARGVVIHDAFQPLNYWNNWMTLPEYYFVILDHHHYQVFSPPEVSRDLSAHISAACQLGYQTQTETLWRVVGEWTAALTDCAKWLNGVGTGARYDGTFPGSYYVGSCDGQETVATWSQQKITENRQYVEAQMQAYDQGAGWIFWCYKTETVNEWDFREMVAAGVVPFPYTNYENPNWCGFN